MSTFDNSDEPTRMTPEDEDHIYASMLEILYSILMIVKFIFVVGATACVIKLVEWICN